jgi:hypothetical protein
MSGQTCFGSAMTPASPFAPIAAAASTDTSLQAGLRPASVSNQDPSYVAWARARQQEERRRRSLLVGLQAQADPSEAAGISGPITAWAEDHARQKRRHANAIAGLHRSDRGLAG